MAYFFRIMLKRYYEENIFIHVYGFDNRNSICPGEESGN